MKKYLLETSTCSYLMANHVQVKARLASVQVTDYPFTCPIVCGEILYGLERLPAGHKRRALQDQVNNLFSGLICDPIPEKTGDFYARIKNEAQKLGTPLDECDLWIASTALVFDAILVTSDSDFRRVQGLFGLQLEDWAISN